MITGLEARLYLGLTSFSSRSPNLMKEMFGMFEDMSIIGQIHLRACCDHKEGRFFNKLIVAMVPAVERDDQTGERTSTFLRYVGSKRQVRTTLVVIPVDLVP